VSRTDSSTMVQQAAEIIEALVVAGAASSIAYYVLCLWSAARFLRQRKTAAEDSDARLSPVSVLKPLKGTDPEMYQSIRSHCLQDYEDYEILFGVSDANDPAVELVERLRSEFPKHAIRLIVCREDLGANTKVSNLAQMLPEARYEFLIVNDGDIRVPPDYLRRVTAPLADSKIGLVTCLYRGVAGPTLGSRLESLGISTDFCAGVLVAQQLEGISFGLGSTLVFRRRDLAAIGGFAGFVDHLADDYELGNRINKLGLDVKLSELVVETFLPHYTMREFFRHQLRWARAVRDSRFGGYLGLGLTFGLPWAALTLLFARGAAWAWALFIAVAIARLLVAVVVGGSVLRDRQAMRSLWLIPLRDVIALFIWLISFTGHTISWRGESFQLKKGKLVRR
jgi:ceramide glucosyltransferase